MLGLSKIEMVIVALALMALSISGAAGLGYYKGYQACENENAKALSDAKTKVIDIERESTSKLNKVRDEYDAKTKVIVDKLAAANKLLLKRSSKRLSGSTAIACKGATGKELARPDAEFLIWIAGRDDETYRDYEDCRKRYNIAREAILKFNKTFKER